MYARILCSEVCPLSECPLLEVSLYRNVCIVGLFQCMSTIAGGRVNDIHGLVCLCVQTYTADPSLEWVDVREWVIEMYPWPSAINVSKLRTLNPEDVGWNHGEFSVGMTRGVC